MFYSTLCKWGLILPKNGSLYFNKFVNHNLMTLNIKVIFHDIHKLKIQRQNPYFQYKTLRGKSGVVWFQQLISTCFGCEAADHDTVSISTHWKHLKTHSALVSQHLKTHSGEKSMIMIQCLSPPIGNHAIAKLHFPTKEQLLIVRNILLFILSCLKYAAYDKIIAQWIFVINSTKELRFPAVIDLNLKKTARDASLNNNDPLILSGQREIVSAWPDKTN